MKNALARSAGLLATCFAATVAHAVPIHFDFTGRVDGGVVGTPVGALASGGFRLESDRLFFAGAFDGIQYSFVDWQPTVTEPLAFLTVGDTTYSVPGSGGGHYAVLGFADGCQPLCNLGWSENFGLTAINQPATDGFTGITSSQAISLFNVYQTELPGFPFWQGFDQFNGADMQPIDVLTLPLYSTSVSFLETTWSCVEGSCSELSSISYTIALDSLTRSSPSQSVPEPGTLALLGLGLAGIAAARRRKTLGSP